jgi:aminoglycoside 3-N-acetyltransferase
MTMRVVTRPGLEAALRAMGLEAGDGVLCHSAVQFLGKPEDGQATYYDALANVIDISARPGSGTLAVPAFNFEFSNGAPYNPRKTPSQGMGVFSEYVRQLPQARRTTHPMQSLAVVGAHADEFARLDTLSAFDEDSAFERMLDLDFTLLLLGADVQAVSIVHYSEQRARVPYRYWKDFSGPVFILRGDDWVEERRTYRMFVRDLDLDPQLDLHPIQTMLEERRQWHTRSLNYGALTACRLRDFVQAADECLARDPWILIASHK